MTDDDRERGRSLAAEWRAARTTAGLSQAQLALAAGVGLDTVRKIERGVIANPGVFTVARCADVMRIGVDALLRPPIRDP